MAASLDHRSQYVDGPMHVSKRIETCFELHVTNSFHTHTPTKKRSKFHSRTDRNLSHVEARAEVLSSMKQLASAALTLSAQIAIVSGKSGLDREMFGQEPAPEVSTKFASKSNWGFTWNPKSCVEVDESGCWPLAQKVRVCLPIQCERGGMLSFLLFSVLVILMDPN